MKTTISGMQFQWDDKKAELNKQKHRISFETAALVFSDPHRVELYDEDHSGDEDRFITIGKVEDVLFVVFTEREDSNRLISARIATAVERKFYYGNS